MLITPPTNLSRYLTVSRDRLKELATKLTDVSARVTELGTDDNQRLLSSWIRYVDGESEYDLVHSCDHFADYRVRRMEIDWLLGTIDSALTYGTSFLHYIPKAADSGTPLTPGEAQLFELMGNAKDGARIYGFDPDHADDFSDPDCQGALDLAKAMLEFGQVYQEVFALKRDLIGRVGAAVEIRAVLDPHKWRPQHESVETLWHATLYADDIAQNGFRPSKPDARKGMGNFGTQSTISLTAEREIAEAIVDCLTDAWDIAHGFVTPADILARIDEEKLDINFRSHFGITGLDELKSPEDGIKLLRLYLAFTKARDNPVFVNPDELLQTLTATSRDAIGIVACTTRIDDAAEFIAGEAEFRVTPDHVVSVAREPYHRTAPPLRAAPSIHLTDSPTGQTL